MPGGLIETGLPPYWVKLLKRRLSWGLAMTVGGAGPVGAAAGFMPLCYPNKLPEVAPTALLSKDL